MSLLHLETDSVQPNKRHFPRALMNVCLPLLVGMLLLVAGGLKGYQWVFEPTAESSILGSRWLLLGQIEFEVLLGLSLLLGVYPRLVRVIALVCFALFLAVSGYQTLAGETSCGCFGMVVSRDTNLYEVTGHELLRA